MPQNPQFPILEQTATSAVFSQLRKLWIATAKKVGKNTFLVTEQELLASTNQTLGLNGHHTLKAEKFSILVTPEFNALLLGVIQPREHCYQTSISFDNQTIYNYINRLRNLYQDNSQIVDFIESQIANKISSELIYLGDFVEKIIDLLSINKDYKSPRILPHITEKSYITYHQLETSLHYQVEQQRILTQFKSYISHNCKLYDTIQITLESISKLLQIDRLVIYQLNVVTDSDDFAGIAVDRVTYEVLATESIPSLLNFQEEKCFRNSQRCFAKYRQGFSLVINDIESGANLSTCLQNLMIRLQVRAKLVTPINLRDNLWGFIIAHQCSAPRQWQNREIKFLRQIASYIAIAVSQNQSYQHLQKQKQLLEKQVEVQAQQIENALVAAQIANQSKNEFLGNMSHELRTPLTRVIGLSGTLLHWSMAQGKIPLPIEKQQQYLKTIHDSGKHLLSLINRILEFSEVESGKNLLNIEKISLYQIARKVLHLCQEEADKKSINLNLDFLLKPTEDIFDADDIRLQEILFNLISNAIKFTPADGQVILRIWREGKIVIFEVEDTGIGIAQQQIPLLFEKFQQLETSRQRIHGGTGLGLALTKQLVELHGGTIEVESTFGQGSLFRVCLPNQIRLHQIENNTITQAHDEHRQAQNIVLITKDEVIATVICELLTAADYKLIWLVDAGSALEKITLLEPKIVIFDQDITVEIYDFIDMIKGIYNSTNLQLILLCSQIEQSEWQILENAGIQDYIIKSTNLTHLLQKLDNLINN
ncbi:MAG: ATP-binding protein [Xenococcus sp. MO_188.B8]|nr:ATP-binding protein [Xenococcus sp. MO_188.B8]